MNEKQPGRYVWLPDDWQAVPKEPTEAMLNGARDWSIKKNGKGVGNDQAIGCYCAMVGAAPSPPEAPAEMRAFGASDAACYKWPDDTAEHRACRAAYIEGAAATSPPQPKLPSEEDIARVISANMKVIPYWNGNTYDFSASAKAVLASSPPRLLASSPPRLLAPFPANGDHP